MRKSPISLDVCAPPVIYSALNNEHNERDGAGEGQRETRVQTTETSDWSSGRRVRQAYWLYGGDGNGNQTVEMETGKNELNFIGCGRRGKQDI